MRFHARRRFAVSLLGSSLLAVALCVPAPVVLAQEAEKALEKADAFTVRIKTTIVYPFGQDKRGTFKGAGFVVDKERGWIATNAHVASRSAAFSGSDRFNCVCRAAAMSSKLTRASPCAST